MNHDILPSTPMRGAATLERPRFTVPAGACDAHVHVFDPLGQYPHVPRPHYTLPDGAQEKLERMCGALGLGRYVIVQPSYYGTDNRCMLDALARAPGRARGVAMVAEDVSREELLALHGQGVRALRLDLFLRSAWPVERMVDYIHDCARRIGPLGWHLQFYTPGWVVRQLLPHLGGIELDFVIDHMGYMLESDGLTRADFDRLLDTLAAGRGWLKLSGPYRVAKDGNFEKLRPLAKAIVQALPTRTIWGSDWPHIPDGGRDTGALLNLLADWVPDEGARTRILVDNPGRLFGF